MTLLTRTDTASRSRGAPSRAAEPPKKREAQPIIDQDQVTARLALVARRERTARAKMEERLGSIEAQRALDRQQLAATQASVVELRASGDRLRAELREKDAEARQLHAEARQLREASVRTAEEYTRALADAKAAAERVGSIEVEPKLIYQPPVKPEAISFEYHKDLNGYLTQVVLKAEGYEDVAVDVIRDAANKMRDLKIGKKK